MCFTSKRDMELICFLRDSGFRHWPSAIVIGGTFGLVGVIVMLPLIMCMKFRFSTKVVALLLSSSEKTFSAVLSNNYPQSTNTRIRANFGSEGKKGKVSMTEAYS